MYINIKRANNNFGDNMIYFFIILVAIVALLFFIPIKFTIYTNVKGQNVYYVDNSPPKNKAYVSLKILGFIPIYVYNKEKKDRKNKESKKNNITIGKIYNAIKNSVAEEEFKITNFTKKILSWCRKIKFKKLVLVVGFNTEDYVKNAYINSSLNSIICMIINKNQDRFNFNKLYYQVAISDYNYYLNIDTVISFSLYRNIDVFITIVKFIFNLKKEADNNEVKSTNNILNAKGLNLGN